MTDDGDIATVAYMAGAADAKADARKRIAELAAETTRLRGQLDAIEEDGTREHNAAVALRQEVARLREAINTDAAYARATCGGDGEGCAAFRPYYATTARRHQKCGTCPMAVLSESIAALAASAPKPAGGDDE